MQRPRLLQRIADGGRPLNLVVAPAGFGKTTFAAQWATHGPPTAWLSVDRRDGLLERFWAHLQAALLETTGDDSALGEVVSASLALPHRPTALDLGRLLAEELFDVSGVRLVIDDLHLVAPGELHAFLTGLLEIAPAHFQLMITTRVEPPLALNRLRLRGMVTELRGDDLLFSVSETEEFVAHTNAVRPHAAVAMDAASLRERTGGWAAGIRLTMIAAAPSSGMSGTPEQRNGSDGALPAWLVAESLAGRPEAERAVLLRTALLERFNLQLADALTEDTLPPQVVREAIDFATRADLCRRSLRNDGDWLEFHPLFRDALRRQLMYQEAPEGLRALHLRAAGWLEETGYIGGAIRHFLAAGEMAAAVAIIEREIRPAFNREDWPAVARWLAELPADVIQQTPRLLLAQGLVAQLRGQPVPIARMHIALEAQLAGGGQSQEEAASLRGEFDCLRINTSTASTIDLQGWLEAAQRATRRIDPAHRYELGLAWLQLGMALSATGKYQQAIERLEAWIAEAGPEIDAGSIRGYLGLLFVHAQAGSLSSVVTTARTTIALAEQYGLRLSAGWGHRFLGDALYEMNDLDGAIEHFSGAAHDHEYFHLTGLREALFGLALAYQATDRGDEAEQALRRAREIAIAVGVLHHLPVIEAQEAYLAHLTGDREPAMRWASMHDPDPGSEPLSVLIHPSVMRGAILSASSDRRDVARGLSSLDRVRQEMVYWGYPGPMVRCDALRAVALLRLGDRETAIAALRAACATARANGHVRSFIELLPAFSRELDNLAAAVMLPTAVQHILRQPAGGRSAHDQAAMAHVPLEALTEREMEVLGYLVQRYSYNEIGNELYISPHTVKRHVTSIYSKLNVSGRLEAITAARELGWVAQSTSTRRPHYERFRLCQK